MQPAKMAGTFTKNAEVPAVPAASKKGANGKQQLDAKITAAEGGADWH